MLNPEAKSVAQDRPAATDRPVARYLSVAETAKLVRKALKTQFPRVSFTVRSRSYSGGASIDVAWTDGPCAAAVEAITGQYSGADFDPMIDLKTTHTSWLLADGSARIARDRGSVGSMGGLPAVDNAKPHPDAKLVNFGANFIFCTRSISTALLHRVVDRLTHKGYPTEVLEIIDTATNAWVRQIDFDRAHTRGFDMEREVRMAVSRTHCS